MSTGSASWRGHDVPFRGFQRPNYTQVPDELFDELLPTLSGAQLKVLLYIIRRTFGFRKTSDKISLSQITDGIVTNGGKRIDSGTGLVKSTAASALKRLVEKNMILKARNRQPGRGDMATTYALNMRTALVQNPAPPVSENRTPPGRKIGHPEGRKSDTQGTVGQETFKNVNVGQETIADPMIKTAPSIPEATLASPYKLTEQQSDEIRRLVDLQIDILGAGERNRAAYVKRATEAVRNRTTNVLRLALGEIKDAGHRRTIMSVPAYFHRVYNAMLAEGLRPKPEQIPARVAASPPADLRQVQRDKLLAAIAAEDCPIPPHLRRAPMAEIAAFYDGIQQTDLAHAASNTKTETLGVVTTLQEANIVAHARSGK